MSLHSQRQKVNSSVQQI